jgi:putative membrane protein
MGPWTFDPFAIAVLALVTLAYARGVAVAWRRGGVGAVVARRRVLAFGFGIYFVVLAVLSPLDAYAHQLFSAHMVQHMLLMFVAAPLLVYGAPVLPLLWALPRRERLRVGRSYARSPWLSRPVRALGHPVVAWCMLAGVLWAWHHPALYQTAVAHRWVHTLEHASMLGAAALFWWVVMQPQGRRSVDRGSALLLVFTTKIQSAAIGVMITFGPAPLYPMYETTAALYGLSAREDQQLAGLVMGVPTGLVFLVSGALLFLAWLREIEARAHGPRPAPSYERVRPTVGPPQPRS